MAVSPFARYVSAKYSIDRKLIALDADNFSFILLTSAYTPDLANDDTFSDVSAHEVSGTGYTAGGEDIGPLVGSIVGTNVRWVPSAPVVWTGCTFNCKYAVLVHRAGGSLVGTDKLIGYSDLLVGGGGSIALVSSPLTLDWDTLGLFRH